MRPGVLVESLNVVSIHELETMAESAEAGIFDIFDALHSRCLRDSEMVLDLHNFLLTVPGYGGGKSERVNRAVDEAFREAENYLFGNQKTKGAAK